MKSTISLAVTKMSVIESLVSLGGLGGGGAGGTGCQTATGFSVSIFPISLSVTSRLSVEKQNYTSYLRSSTKCLFFMLIRNPRWPLPQDIE